MNPANTGAADMDDTSLSQKTSSRRTLLLAAATSGGLVLSGGITVHGTAAHADVAAAPELAVRGAVPSLRTAITQLGLEGVRPRGMRAVLAQAHVHTVRELLDQARTARELPPQLQFRLRGFSEHASNDKWINGVNDEVYLSAVGTDSSDVTLDADGKPRARTIITPSFGDVSDDSIRNAWKQNPHVLMSFDLRHPANWPRAFVVTLLLVEKDDEDLANSFQELLGQVGGKIRSAVESAAAAGAGAIAGATIGTVIPGIGTVVGAAVGALAVSAYDELVTAVTNGLKNDIFSPLPVGITFPDPGQVRRHTAIGKPQVLEIKELGAHYTIEYDWFLAS
ncbi:hypothetical protein [Actinoplanes awajinensis]|nr:hypothetical protein [Actinoplanes awajinensis]